MPFAPPDWRPIRVVAVAPAAGAEDRSPDDGATPDDGWIDDLADAAGAAADLAFERLGPEATLERLADGDVGIDPAPDRIDCLVTPSDPGDRDTAAFVAAVRERDRDVPVVVHPGVGSVEEAADVTAAGADRYLVRPAARSPDDSPADSNSPGNHDSPADDTRTDLLATVRTLADDHDAVRTDLLARQLLRAILDDLQLVAFFKDRDGRHVCASAQVANAHNESVIGKTDLDLYEAETGEPARRAYQDDLAVAREGKRVVDKEERFATDHGDANWLRTTKVPWYGPAGDRRGLIGLTHTINKEKAREAELRRERRRLEAFASFVSHDLRNPVSIASGYLDLARETGDPEALANVEEAVERMDRLIDDVLALVEPGSPDESLQWLSLREAVEDAWQRVDAPDASLTVTVPESVELFAEAGLLELLLANVLTNAVEHGSTSPRSTTSREDAVEHGSTSPPSQAREDATQHAGDAVAIEVGTTPDGFYVADDGPGIDAEDPSRVFEYGYTDGGVGLGLAIVSEVAAYHRWVPTVDDWVGDPSSSDDPAWTDDVGASVDPPAHRGFDGACFRIGRCILRTAAHRDATVGDAVDLTESTDVGDPGLAGETSRPDAGAIEDADGAPIGPDAWRVDGVGRNLWRDVEGFHLAYANVLGDVRIVARLADLEYASEYSKAGVLIARWPSAGEPLSFLGSIGVHGCESIRRPTPGSVLSIRNLPDLTDVPISLRLDRIGRRVTCYYSIEGEDWTPVDQHVLDLDGSVVVGLAVCSHNEDRRSTAIYDRVRITPLSTRTE